MKHFYNIFLLSLAISLPSVCSAKITFHLDFADPPGTGFHTRPEAKKAMYEALNEAADWFDDSYDAVLRYRVTASITASAGFLAKFSEVEDEHTIFTQLPGIHKQKAMQAILDSKIHHKCHGQLFVDLNHPWSFSDSVLAYQSDFKRVVIHEFIHSLGFISLLDCTDFNVSDSCKIGRHTQQSCVADLQSMLTESQEPTLSPIELQNLCRQFAQSGDSEFSLSNFAFMDTFISKDNGTPLIDPTIQNDIKSKTCDDLRSYSGSFFFQGPESLSIPLRSSSPLTFDFFSHIENTFPYDHCIMNPSDQFGVQWRTPCAHELDMLKAMGYKFKIKGREMSPVYCTYPRILKSGETVKVALTHGYDISAIENASKPLKYPRPLSQKGRILGSASPNSWIFIKVNDVLQMSFPLTELGCKTYNFQSPLGNFYILSFNILFDEKTNTYNVAIKIKPKDSVDVEDNSQHLFSASLPSLNCIKVQELPRAALFLDQTTSGPILFSAKISHPAPSHNLDEPSLSIHSKSDGYIGFISKKSKLILYGNSKEVGRYSLDVINKTQNLQIELDDKIYNYALTIGPAPTQRHIYAMLQDAN